MELINRFNGEIIFKYKCNSLKELVIEAINNEISLRNIDFSHVDLSGINLSGSDLCDNNFSNTNFSNTNFSNTNLCNANFHNADLYNANLSNVNLCNVTGNMKEIRNIDIDTYPIVFTKTFLQIGCQGYRIEKWKNFSDYEISEMDDGALEWWNKWKEFIFTAIDLSFEGE